MRAFFRKRHIAPLIALVLFMLSTTGALFAYDLMLKGDRGRALLFGHASLGSQAYLGKSQGRCVAFFSTSLKRQGESSVIKIEGVLKALYRTSQIPLTFKLTAYFNALGQMIGSFFKITFLHNQISLGTLSINPIKVRLTANFQGKAHRFQTNIPGPIELVEEQDGSFRLRYSLLKKNSLIKQHQQNQSLWPEVDFALIPAASPEITSCFGTNMRLPRSGRGLRTNAAGKQRRRWRKIERDLTVLDLNYAIKSLQRSWSYLEPLLNLTAIKPATEKGP